MFFKSKAKVFMDVINFKKFALFLQAEELMRKIEKEEVRFSIFCADIFTFVFSSKRENLKVR